MKVDWINILFIGSVHLLAVFSVVYMAAIHFSWWTLGLSFLWFGLCGFAITGGYHRFFAHPSYKTNRILQAFHLFFGAASIQNSALKWSADHRRHHSRTDTDLDPYNIRRGFMWAHILWIFYKDTEGELEGVKDLQADPLVHFQHRYYLPLVAVSGFILPAALGMLWGDWIGALLVVGFLRLVVQWHATFAVNSVAHTIGNQPYSKKNSARDSFWTALVTLGEGYHNFHHKFQLDYRNGIRWYQFDPTKWAIWSLSCLGITGDLRRTPESKIRQARQSVLAVD
ncbi:MAG: hypothetical protein CMJ89_16525 [Planctomycetes bacterium]|nr:hypothetical protein [Planctomycetota bacterium]